MWARRSRKQSCAILLFIDGGGGGWVSEAISIAGGVFSTSHIQLNSWVVKLIIPLFYHLVVTETVNKSFFRKLSNK